MSNQILIDGFEFTVKIPNDNFDKQLFKSFIEKNIADWKGNPVISSTKGNISYIEFSADPDTDPSESGYFEAHISIDWEENKGLPIYSNDGLDRHIPVKLYLAVDGVTEKIFVIYSIKHRYMVSGSDTGTTKTLPRFSPKIAI